MRNNGVGCVPSVWPVPLTLCVCVYLHVCLLAPTCQLTPNVWLRKTCSLWDTRSPSEKHPFTSQAPRSAAGLLFAQSRPTAGCRRGVRWSGPGLIRLHPLPFYVSVTNTPLSICPSIHPLTPQAAQHKHLLPTLFFCLENQTLSAVCVCVCPSHLPLYPEPPSSGHCLELCLCVLCGCVCCLILNSEIHFCVILHNLY